MLEDETLFDEPVSTCSYDDDFDHMVTKQAIVDGRSDWTLGAIKRFLGTPCLLKSQRKYKSLLHLYHVDCVLDAEETVEFKAYVMTHKPLKEKLQERAKINKTAGKLSKVIFHVLFREKLVAPGKKAESICNYMMTFLFHLARSDFADSALHLALYDVAAHLGLGTKVSKEYVSYAVQSGLFKQENESIQLCDFGCEMINFIRSDLKATEEISPEAQARLDQIQEKFREAELRRSSASSHAEQIHPMIQAVATESISSTKH